MVRSLTYAELAEALKITPESANRLARRKRWPRTQGNDGRVRVTVPEDAFVHRDSPPDGPLDDPPVSPPDSPPDNPVHVLQAQIARLEGELAGMREALTEARARAAGAEARAEAAEARAEKQAADFAAAEARAEKQLAAAVADLAAEKAKTEKAIEAFASLAERLDQLAAERRPWWRRFVG